MVDGQEDRDSLQTDDEISITDDNGWEEIGIHRPIASFWYQYILLLVVAIPALLMYGFVIPNYILPYPAALGFQSMTITFFSVLFDLMDVATKPACERFVAEHAEVNPEKALKYVQFFVYFQMFTGLIQITGIAIFCFKYIIYTDLNYAMWFFLFYSTTQFPGMLASYTSTLKAFQRFDRSTIVEIIQGVVFENITQIIFILLGRYWGANNPAIGELMGATIGFIIGKYIDDFFAMLLAGYFVHNLLKPYGMSVKQTLRPEFTKEEAKESLVYGLKLLGSTVISRIADYFTLIMMISWVPNYISIIGYIEIARTIANVVNTRYNFTALLAESYNNKKKHLTKYTITRYFSHWWYFAFFLTLQISILFPPVLERLGGDWGRAAWIIPIYVLPRLMVVPPVMGAEILQACDRPMYRTYGIIAEKVTKTICVFIFMSPWGLPRIFGEGSIIILYILHDIPAYIAITLVEFGLAHKKIVKIEVNWWQTLVAGTLASLPLLPIDFGMLAVFNYVWGISPDIVLPIVVVAIDFLIFLFLMPAGLFFFFGFFGGWDEVSITEFEKAIDLTGPSKFIVKFFGKAARIGHERSLFKNKFTTDHEKAYEEIEELMRMKAQIIKTEPAYQ